jgi:ElaB/YqjD/DUF883 family membrane-anchored ribosome-binding protein
MRGRKRVAEEKPRGKTGYKGFWTDKGYFVNDGWVWAIKVVKNEAKQSVFQNVCLGKAEDVLEEHELQQYNKLRRVEEFHQKRAQQEDEVLENGTPTADEAEEYIQEKPTCYVCEKTINWHGEKATVDGNKVNIHRGCRKKIK